MPRRYHEIQIRLDANDGIDPRLRQHLAPPEQLPDGGWVVEGVLAKGDTVKTYPWGREFVPWSAISDPSIPRQAPGRLLTEGHPVRSDGQPGVDAHNARQSRRGVVLGAWPIEEHKALAVRFRAEVKPTVSGLSGGWASVQIDETPGRHDGIEYDAVQRSMFLDHVALTPTPRDTNAAARLDSLDAEGNHIITYRETTTTPTPKRKRIMPTLTIGNVSCEVPDAVATALANEQAALKARADEATQSLNSLTRERDELKGKVTALEATRLNEAAFEAEIKQRIDTIQKAKPFIKDEAVKARLDAMTPYEVMRAACEAMGVPVEETASKDVVKATFDTLVAVKAPNPNASRGDAARADSGTASQRAASTFVPNGQGGKPKGRMTLAQLNAKHKHSAPVRARA
jgi:hypothetical protein